MREIQALTLQAALSTTFPGRRLGTQLKSIASMVAARGALETSRQIFFCGINGFDTHANQLSTQANLLADLDASLEAFLKRDRGAGCLYCGHHIHAF